MNTQTITLNKSELLHPVFYLLFVGCFSAFTTLELIGKSYSEITAAIPWLILFYIIHQILHVSKRVALKQNEIIDGVYINPFGFVKINNRIKITEIIDVGIAQNSKKYFEILAKSKEGQAIIIKVLANKYPAERELEHIKQEINKFKTEK